MALVEHYSNIESIIIEYENIINNFVTIIKEELSLITRCLALYGSYNKIRKENIELSEKYFIPGESDLDLVMVINTHDLTENHSELFQNVTDSLASILFEPIYVSIIDLTMIEAKIDFPPALGSNFGPLQIKAVKETGKVLWGKNDVFKDEYYSSNMIKQACRVRANKTWENLKDAFLHRDMYRMNELFWMGVDSVLDCGHTYAAFLGGESLVRMEVAEFLETQNLDEKFRKIISLAHDYRLKTRRPVEGQYQYFKSCLSFCRKINELTIPNEN